MLINYHWNSATVLFYLYLFQMVPYLLQLTTFFIWSNFLLVGDEITHDLRAHVITTILGTTSAWQLLLEFRQFTVQGYVYFFNLWNYLEVIPLILILRNVAIFKTPTDSFIDETFFRIQSVSSLLMWCKFAYYLRSFE